MVENERSDESFRPGDRVAVPWGLDVLDGTVVSSSGYGPSRHVVVEVSLPDTEEEFESQLVTFPAKELEAAANVASERRPGAWLTAHRYEEALRRVLEHLVRTETGISITSAGLEHTLTTSQMPDFTLNAGDHQLVIEAKTVTSGGLNRQAVDQLLKYLDAFPATTGLIVTDAPLSSPARARINEAAQSGYDIRVVHWRSPDDNPELDRTILELLAAA